MTIFVYLKRLINSLVGTFEPLNCLYMCNAYENPVTQMYEEASVI